MKSIYILFAIAGIALFSHCKKETLPPIHCNPIKFHFLPYGGGHIDSMAVTLIRSDIKNGERLDTMIYNPTSGNYTVTLSFCGPFQYKVKIYNTIIGGPYYGFTMYINNHWQISTNLSDNEYFEGYYIYEFPL